MALVPGSGVPPVPVVWAFRWGLGFRSGALVGVELAGGLDGAGLAGDEEADATGDGDCVVADSVIEADNEIDARRNDLDARSVDLLARQAPVASDLRTVVSSMRMSGDLERMGDLARHVAQVARMRYPGHAVPDELRETFQQMGQIAETLVDRVATIIISQDLGEARDIEQIDDQLDDLHREMFTRLAEGSWKHGTTSAVDIALLSRYYERFGDHAVTVARRVVFLVTGQVGAVELPEESERG